MKTEKLVNLDFVGEYGVTVDELDILIHQENVNTITIKKLTDLSAIVYIYTDEGLTILELEKETPLQAAIKALENLQEYNKKINSLLLDNNLSYDNLKEVQLKLEEVQKQL